MEIVNIVVSGSLNQKVDLHRLRDIGDRYSYDPEMYHAGYIRLQQATATVYRSGKYIIPGIKSVSAIDTLWDELKSVLSSYLDESLFSPPSVRNMVAKADFGRSLPLSLLISVLAEEGAEYEPEVFPGLMWTTEYGAVNIFQTGRVMILGGKSVDNLETCWTYVSGKIALILEHTGA